MITWRSKKQNIVSRSSARVESEAIAHGICKMLQLKKVLEELRELIEGPMKLCHSNKVVISIAHNIV